MQSLLYKLLVLLFFLPSMALAQLYEIKKGSKWGLINRAGKTVLPLNYDYVYPDQERAYFFTRKGRKTGLYHPKNNVRIEPNYDLIFAPNPKTGYFFQIVEKGKYGLLDSTGNLLIKPEYNELKFFGEDYYTFRKDRYWGMGSRFSSVSIPAKYARIIPFNNKKSLFFIGTSYKGNSTIWDAKGKVIVSDLNYEVVKLVGESFVYKDKGRYGLLNKNGQELTKAIYNLIYPTGKHIGVLVDRARGVYSSTGQAIIPAEYERLKPDSSGSVWFRDSLHWGVINAKGSVISQPQFDQPGNFFGPVSSVKQGSNYGVINHFGEFLIPLNCSTVKLYAGMVRGKKGDKWRQVLFDEDGRKRKKRKLIITTDRRQYEYAEYRALLKDEQEEKAGWFKEDNAWGLRDTMEGKILIEPTYWSVEVLEDLGITIVSHRAQFGKNVYGLVNHLSGQIISQPAFQKVYPYDLKDADAFRALNKNKLVIVSRQGRVRKIPNAMYISPPHQGVFRVMNGESPLSGDQNEILESKLREQYANWKLIDEVGNTIGKPMYNYIGPFYQGIATARKGQKKTQEHWGLIDTRQKEVMKSVSIMLIDPGNNSPLLLTQQDTSTYHLMDSAGNFLVARDQFWMNPDSQLKLIDEIENFREGMAKVKIGNKWGFMNTKGKILIPPIYNKVNDFYQGRAAVKLKKGWGYLNQEGVAVIKPKYRKAENFSNELAAVRAKSGWGFINQRGKKVLKPKMKKTAPYVNHLGPAKSRYWGLVDERGKWVIKPSFSQIQRSGDFWKVRKDGMYGFVDNQGNLVLKPKYPNLGVVSENLVSFMRKSRHGFINLEGEIVIHASYREVNPFSEGLAGMNYGGSWGFIDTDNNTVIQPQYAEVGPFKSGVAAARKRRLWGMIDRVGETILPFVYSEITRNEQGWIVCKTLDHKWEYYDPHGIRLSHRSFEYAKPITNRLAISNLQGRKNVINILGIPITYPGYEQIVKAGKEVIIAENNHLQGLINRQGKEIIPPIYESIKFIDGYYLVSRHGEIGYLDQNGNWLYPLSR